MASPTTGTESVIAGYFQSGENAHRAIQALLDEGFLPSQIGAAFHSSGTGAAAHSTGSSAPSLSNTGVASDEFEDRGDLQTTYAGGGHGSGSSIGGPASDTTAVTPSGLAAGSGLPFAGIGRKGEIPGADLDNTGLQSELRHELPHDGEASGSAAYTGSAASSAAAEPPPHSGSGPSHHVHPGTQHASGSWTEKLKHLFTPTSTTATTTAATGSVPGVDSQNFGTGEGSLGLIGRPFTATRFASSAQQAGVPAEHSRGLSHRLSRGGAVVTVSLTGRLPEVERIFERFGGEVRFESGMFSEDEALTGDNRVEVFGHLEHYYPES